MRVLFENLLGSVSGLTVELPVSQYHLSRYTGTSELGFTGTPYATASHHRGVSSELFYAAFSLT
jgi:hypothetical protein